MASSGPVAAKCQPLPSPLPPGEAAGERRAIPRGTRLLVIDDEPSIAGVIERILDDFSPRITHAVSGEEGFRRLEDSRPDAVFLDLRLPGLDGFSVLRRMKEAEPSLPVIMISGYGDIPAAVEAMRLGAVDFLPKPFEVGRLRSALRRALARTTPGRGERGRERAAGPDLLFLMGGSESIRRLCREVERVAPTSLSVLIQGETGTGKELVARAIHGRSRVREGPFVAVDCGAIAGGVAESELFGHERGAFTGAHAPREGLFARAAGGTLLLDEVSNLPGEIQRKFLRVLEEREYLPVGGRRPRPLRARILASSNVPLREQVAAGRFRADLFHRLNQFTLDLPPLRERKEDIPALARRFLAEANRELGKEIRDFTPEALRALEALDYPGNVRELRNMVRRRALLAEDAVRPDHLSLRGTPSPADAIELRLRFQSIRGASLKSAAREVLDKLERQIIEEVLGLTRQNKSEAARWLGINRVTLYHKLARLGLIRRPRAEG